MDLISSIDLSGQDRDCTPLPECSCGALFGAKRTFSTPNNMYYACDIYVGIY
jgi:hypothetical protein